MYVTAFYELMRIGEITKDRWGNVSLHLSNLTFHASHIVLKITKFKHNISQQPFDIVLCKQSEASICPVTCLLNYLKMRGSKPGPLFCYPNLKPVSREFFTTVLKNNLNYCGLSTEIYKSHSYRIGGASYYASLGLSDEQIRILGRWKCDAFKLYIRSQRILSAIAN